MKKTLKIKLTFIDMTPDEEGQAGAPVASAAPDVSEFCTDAEFSTGERCEILYKENPDLGMGACTVRISWLASDPSVISVIRNGETETVMSFEQGKRHISRYNMGTMAFELTTRTLRSINTFDGTLDGEIYVDYIVEVRGGFVGRRKMSVGVLP
jgi:uncharacterized beta-barrel protein YwiB (DUF1934 family)